MKLYRAFGGIHYKSSMYPPFVESNWTPSRKEAQKAYESMTLKDFKKSNAQDLDNAQVDQLPIKLEKPSKETYFLWIELAEVNLNRKKLAHLWGDTKYPPNDLVLELADYDQNELAERGIWLNGRKMSQKTLTKILY